LQARVSPHVVPDREVADRSQVRVAKKNVHVFNERSNVLIDALTTRTR
jgi:fibrillarin-like rRNA methylase